MHLLTRKGAGDFGLQVAAGLGDRPGLGVAVLQPVLQVQLTGLAHRRQGFPLHPIAKDIAVGHQSPVGVEHPCALRLGNEQKVDGLAGEVGVQRRFGIAAGGRLLDDIGDERALGRKAADLGVDQTLAGFVQHQGPGDQDRQAEQVQEQD